VRHYRWARRFWFSSWGNGFKVKGSRIWFWARSTPAWWRCINCWRRLRKWTWRACWTIPSRVESSDLFLPAWLSSLNSCSNSPSPGRNCSLSRVVFRGVVIRVWLQVCLMFVPSFYQLIIVEISWEKGVIADDNGSQWRPSMHLCIKIIFPFPPPPPTPPTRAGSSSTNGGFGLGTPNCPIFYVCVNGLAVVYRIDKPLFGLPRSEHITWHEWGIGSSSVWISDWMKSFSKCAERDDFPLSIALDSLKMGWTFEWAMFCTSYPFGICTSCKNCADSMLKCGFPRDYHFDLIFLLSKSYHICF